MDLSQSWARGDPPSRTRQPHASGRDHEVGLANPKHAVHNIGSARHIQIDNFPFLSKEEFRDACHYLESRYMKAELGFFRTQFKLSTHRMSFDTDDIWVKIIRPIFKTEAEKEEERQLSYALEGLAWGGSGAARMDTEMEAERKLMDIDAEDADMAALNNPNVEPNTTTGSSSGLPPGYSADPQQPYVVYEIHLHPTYQMPCLYFSLHDLPSGDDEFSIDSVFRYVVPDQFKQIMRNAGFAEGAALSAAPNPVTNIPSFLVHPCQSREAMAQWQDRTTLENYLMVWLGISGHVVGLSMPITMA